MLWTVEEFPVWGLAGVSWRHWSKRSEMGIVEFIAGRTMGKTDSSRMENKIFGREIKKLRSQVLEELFQWILKS